MEDDERSASDLVRRLLNILADEVERNPRLAARVAAALPKSMKSAAPAPRRQPAFNASEYHPVKILRAHGENMLRGRLLHLNNREKLRAVARASNLTLNPSANRPKATVAEVVEAIVKAAVDYDRQRNAATDAS